jgi:hypothetical protein
MLQGVVVERELPRPYRILKPGAMETKDYSPSRLNIYIDDNGIIETVNYH